MVTGRGQHATCGCAQHEGTSAGRRGYCQCHRVAEIIGRRCANAKFVSPSVIAEGTLDFNEIQAVCTGREVGASIKRATKIVGLENLLAGSVVNDDQRVDQGVELRGVRCIAQSVDHVHLALGEASFEPVAVAVVGDQTLHRCARLQHTVGQNAVAKIIGQGRARQGVSALACIA